MEKKSLIAKLIDFFGEKPVEDETTQDETPRLKSNSWGISGRSSQMLAGTMMQLKAYHSKKSCL